MRRIGLVLFIIGASLLPHSAAVAQGDLLGTVLYLGASVIAQNQHDKWTVRAIQRSYEGQIGIVRAENEPELEAVKRLAPAQATATVLGAKDKRDLTHALIELRKSNRVSEEAFVDALQSLAAMDAGSVQGGGITIGQPATRYGYGGATRFRRTGGLGRGGYRGRPYYNPYDQGGSLAAGAEEDRIIHEQFLERAAAANRAARGW